MTIVKPHTLNRPLADLRQLREHPELIGKLSAQEQQAIALYAISREEQNRPNHVPMDRTRGDVEIVRQAAV